MGFFNYDSKLMQALGFLADLLILNVCFLFCCLPIFTIGAAQAGLYTAIKVLTDKEDDSSAVRAFFRGFSNGFGRITLPWMIFAVIIAMLGYSLLAVLAYRNSGMHAPLGFSIAGLAVIALFQSMLPPFHARFSCTSWQLVKNTWFFLLAHPLRCILVTALTWLPLVLALVDTYTFVLVTPAWLALYYSVAFAINFVIMKKPYDELTQSFLDSQAPAEAIGEAGTDKLEAPEAESEDDDAEPDAPEAESEEGAQAEQPD